MAIASNNPYPSVLIVEGTAPSAPAAGQQRLFIDSADHAAKTINSSSVVTPLGGALTSFMTQLGADVTSAATNVFQDVITHSCAAGTWSFTATMTLVDTSFAVYWAIRIWDGTTIYAAANNTTGGAGYSSTITVANIIVVLGSTTTMRVSGASNGAASSKYKADAGIGSIPSTGNVACTFSGIRIA